MNLDRRSLAAATALVGLSTGFFFAYQFSVIRGLADVDDETYVTTFRSLNATIRNPYFGIVFFGSLPATAVALAMNWRTSIMRRSAIAAALVLYVACMAITVAGNVPLNNELADTVAGFAEARADFEDSWNRLNLIRTINVVASLLCLAGAGALADRQDADRSA